MFKDTVLEIKLTIQPLSEKDKGRLIVHLQGEAYRWLIKERADRIAVNT